ncbi:VIT1/CCC1 transporter family protein [Brevundimonas pishanensis]|uniref:VIT1/CCC1 transporter family protein n=1 Tax=Brevundimonas pishanensis TaxID=2896315 RepID=UPI001FA74403|nr:VIT family protein [Brevundimonas pishanensis]
MAHRETHRFDRIGWLRAAVLGANDGLVSTASLVVGVAAASASHSGILVAGIAGLVAGAMSMAAGEYVSVSSQSDTEKADLARERDELANMPEAEVAELRNIYIKRGVSPDVAETVARQMMEHDALGAHARDELGISEITAAKPIQAAITSAATFSAGAAIPLAVAALAPLSFTVPAVFGSALAGLAILGVMGAKTGGAPVTRSVVRVIFWGILAMAITAGVGKLFGVAV